MNANTRAEIENTLYHYSWTMDRDHLDQIGLCFTEDARVDFDGALKVGREAIVGELSRRRENYRETNTTPWHVITNTYITEETDSTATVRSFFVAVRSTADGTPKVNSIGYYDDKFVDDGDAWRVKERRVVSAKKAGEELADGTN